MTGTQTPRAPLRVTALTERHNPRIDRRLPDAIRHPAGRFQASLQSLQGLYLTEAEERQAKVDLANARLKLLYQELESAGGRADRPFFE